MTTRVPGIHVAALCTASSSLDGGEHEPEAVARGVCCVLHAMEGAKESPSEEPPIADAVQAAMGGMAATLEEAQEKVMEGLQKMKKEAVESMYNDAVGFYHAVDWSQSWLHALGAFHVAMWLACILARRSYEAQMVLLVLIRTPPLPICTAVYTTHLRAVCAHPRDSTCRSRARLLRPVDQRGRCGSLERVCGPKLL